MSDAPLLDRDELMAELGEAARRFEALLRSIQPDDMTRPTPGLAWNVGETAAHVLTVVRRWLGDRRRSSSPAGTAELNALGLSELTERNPQQLADLFASDMETVLNTVCPRVPDDLRFPFNAGTTTTIRPAMAILVGELMIHGNDIAAAVGRPWPIAPHTAALIWLGATDVSRGWLKEDMAAGLNETYVIHFAGEAQPVALQIADGTVRVGPAANKRADFVLRVDPVAFLFTFPYGRRPATDPAIARLVSLFEPV